jgi:hypothetical protein
MWALGFFSIHLFYVGHGVLWITYCSIHAVQFPTVMPLTSHLFNSAVTVGLGCGHRDFPEFIYILLVNGVLCISCCSIHAVQFPTIQFILIDFLLLSALNLQLLNSA